MVEPDVNKEYDLYAHIVNADEQYMPSWCMYFCSLSDGNLRHEGEVDVVNFQSDELGEDNNVEYYRNMKKHGKEFKKELVNASDVLQSCNYPVSRPQDTVNQMSTEDQNQEMIVDDGISVPSKNLYSSTATNKVLVKKMYNSDEQELRCFSKKQQVFKEYRSLGLQSSIPTSDCYDIASGRDRNKEGCDSTRNRSKETTNQCTDECTCVAIQETSTGYYDGYQDHSSEDHSNNTPLHLGEDYHPKKIEYLAAPTWYWYFPALDNYFHLEEDETDCELQTNDCPEFVVVSSLVRAESMQTSKQCFINGQTLSRVVRRRTYSHRCVSFINLLLLSSTTLSCVSGSVAFDEVPVTQEVATGAEAVFSCRHPTADIISWRVNGSLVGRSPPPPDIILGITRDGNGNLVDTLTITARPQYNGTEVVCAAWFFDEGTVELSQPVILIVLVNASAVEDIFLISPASLNVTVDTVAVFQCQHPNAHSINWKINGSILQDFPDGFSTVRNDSVFSLNIEALAEYNQTVIQCVAFFADSPSEESERSIMMIQGTLQNVTNLSRNGSTISWSPPLSLNLTNIEPDIVYCVEVYNITCGRRDLIISDCDDVTEPNYFSDELLDGYIYEYIVTPRSNVSRARNGTPSQPLRELFAIFSVNSPHLMAEDSSMTYMYEAELNYDKTKTSNRQMPSTCMLLLESLDGLSDSKETIACNRDSNLINLEVHPRRLWKCTVLANGCQNDSVLEEYPELSTHDIQNISVSSPSVGSIAVTGYFIQGSTAIGVLIITIDGSNGTQYHLYHRNGNDVQVEDTISGLAGGDHRLSAFVLEQSGHPFNRTATTPKSVNVTIGSELAPSSAILYDILSNSTHICVTCIFKSSTPTSCLVVIHQRISQLSSSGLMNIESSHKFTRSGDIAYGCIQTNLTEYQVGVIDGKLFSNIPQEGSSSACVACIAGSVLALVVIVVSNLVVVIIALIYRKMLKDRRQDILEASVYIMEEDTSSGNQYEHIPLSTPTKPELSIGENMPLVSTHRVESDGDGDAEGNNKQSNFQTPPTLSPPMIPQAAAELTKVAVEATKIIYSEPDHRPNPEFSAPPPQGDEPQYSSVSNFKNFQGVVYACHVVKPPTTTTQQLISDDSTKPLFEYSELIHPPNCQPKPATTHTATHSNNAENPTSPIVPSSPTPCTVGNLLPLLRPIASKWFSLGEALSIDEDDLDIIDTNNETDEACLQDMLEFHEEKSDFQHTWEVMATALREINQEGLSEKMQNLHIQPYTNPLPGQTEVVCTEGSPTSDVTTEDNVPELPLYEHSDTNSTSGYSSGKSPSADSNDLSNSSDNKDEGYADAGVDGQCTPTQNISVQPAAQDIPKKDGIVHVHNSGPKFQPRNPKQPVRFQHLNDDNPEQRKVHGQCEDDVKPPTPADNHLMVVDKIQSRVSAHKEKKHHHITVDQNQDPSERNSFPRRDVPVQHTSQSILKTFPYEQDNYFKVSQANEDHAGNDKETSYLHTTTSSTIPLTEYTTKLADQANVGDCLWQIRAQALSQEGTEIHRSDDTRQKACPSAETVLNKRLRVDQRNKRRTNFHRFQEIAR